MKLPPLVSADAELSAQELSRYSRHILLPEIGLEGQKRLKNSRVLVIGAGGLGSSALLYLAAAGVGTLGIIDFDRVSKHRGRAVRAIFSRGTSPYCQH